jgi:hypothetical protein
VQEQKVQKAAIVLQAMETAEQAKCTTGGESEEQLAQG